jgi:flagellar hook-associated protein 3 FlgL
MSDFISTQYLSSSMRLSVLRMQSDLATLQTESTSGQYADVGLHLGSQAGEEISLQNENGLLQTGIHTNSVVAARLSTTQSALDSLRSTAQSALTALTEWTPETDTGSTLQNLGANSLQSLISTANTSVGGQYIFAGINTGVAPMTDYTAPPAAAHTAIQTAFTAYLAALAPPATPQTVTGVQMQGFLSTPAFVNQFQEPAWSAAGSNWSSASSTNINSNISPTERIDTSTNVNQPGFHQLTQAYAMLNEFTGAGVPQGAMQVVVSQAAALINKGMAALTTTEATIGAAQQRVTDANDNMSAQMTILQTQIDNLDSVNPYQTATQVSSLTTQLQTAYSLTSQLQQLSLVKYL